MAKNSEIAFVKAKEKLKSANENFESIYKVGLLGASTACMYLGSEFIFDQLANDDALPPSLVTLVVYDHYTFNSTPLGANIENARYNVRLNIFLASLIAGYQIKENFPKAYQSVSDYCVAGGALCSGVAHTICEKLLGQEEEAPGE